MVLEPVVVLTHALKRASVNDLNLLTRLTRSLRLPHVIIVKVRDISDSHIFVTKGTRINEPTVRWEWLLPRSSHT